MIYALELLILQVIIVFVIDISGFINTIKRFISKLLINTELDNYSIKPFDCSLCMTFWCGLIYILCHQVFNIVFIGWICLLAFLTPITSNLLFSIKDKLIKWTTWKN